MAGLLSPPSSTLAGDLHLEPFSPPTLRNQLWHPKPLGSQDASPLKESPFSPVYLF